MLMPAETVLLMRTETVTTTTTTQMARLHLSSNSEYPTLEALSCLIPGLGTLVRWFGFGDGRHVNALIQEVNREFDVNM